MKSLSHECVAQRVRPGVRVRLLMVLVAGMALLSAQPVLADDPSPNERFIDRVFWDLLNRAPEAGERAAHVAALDSGFGRSDMVWSVMNVAEFRRMVISDYFQYFLGRPADAEGMMAMTELLERSGRTYPVINSIMGSQEYWSRNASSNEGFLSAVWGQLLGRPPADDEIMIFSNWINEGNERAQVAARVLASDEFGYALIYYYYDRFLRRAGDDEGVNFFVSVLRGGMSDLEILAGFVASEEYFRNAQGVSAPVIP